MGRYDAEIERAARENDLPVNFLHTLFKIESNNNPNAQSPVGAQGLGQLMPATAKEMGVTNPFDPIQNINGSARYLGKQYKAFNGDPELTYAAYNAGPGAVRKYGGTPPYKETRGYVARAMKLLNPIGTANADETPYDYNLSEEDFAPKQEAPAQNINYDLSESDFEPVKQEGSALGHVAGLGGRAVLEGAASIPGNIYNTAQIIPNALGMKGLLYDAPKSINTKQGGSWLADKLGLPVPSEAERPFTDAAAAAAAIAVPSAILSKIPAAAGILDIIGMKNPLAGTVGAAAGSLAGTVAEKSGAKPWQVAAANVAGNVAGGSATGVIKMTGRSAGRVVATGTNHLEGVAGRTLNRVSGNQRDQVQNMLEAGVIPNVKPIPGHAPTSSSIAGNAGVSGLARFAQQGINSAVDVAERAFNNAKAIKDFAQKAVGTEAHNERAQQKLWDAVEEIAEPMKQRDLPTDITAVKEAFNKAIYKHKGHDIIEPTLQSMLDKLPEDTSSFRVVYNIKKRIDDALRGKYQDPSSQSLKSIGTELGGIKKELANSLEASEPGFKDFLKMEAIGINKLERRELAQKILTGASNEKVPMVHNTASGQEVITPLSPGALATATKNTKNMSKLSAPQRDILKNSSDVAIAANRQNTGLAVGSNTAQNLRLEQVIADDVARAFGEDTKHNFLSRGIAGASKMVSGNKLIGRLEDMSEIFAKTELNPKYASILMKKYKLPSDINIRSEAGRVALRSAILNQQGNK